jgi:hypothetical protein
MGRTEVLQGLREMKFESVLDRWRRRELTQEEAAEVLGMKERTFRRWRDRYEEAGLEGLHDRRLGKASAKRVPVDEALRVEEVGRPAWRGFFHFATRAPAREYREYYVCHTAARVFFVFFERNPPGQGGRSGRAILAEPSGPSALAPGSAPPTCAGRPGRRPPHGPAPCWLPGEATSAGPLGGGW